jgi:hypothetical protein
MSISSLPLSYCTNVHPGVTVAEVIAGIRRYTAEVQQTLGAPIAAGLWLAQPVVAELQRDAGRLQELGDALCHANLTTYTFNAFPYGNFHSERVKEQVYLPDWTQPARLDYTIICARVLAQLLPEGVEGSLSTVPLGFKSLCQRPDFRQQSISQLIRFAQAMDELHDDTGQVLRLAIEPEPLCVLETTPETIEFFKQLRDAADTTGDRQAVDRHIGVCYDVCHQSVEFEDVAASIRELGDHDIRINKVHITCAIELQQPTPQSLAELSQFVEPRYLHQTFARSRSGQVLSYLDLDKAICEQPPAGFHDAETWRVHFHVPVDTESLGLLGTTRADLRKALLQVQALNYAPHLEVETYTWGVLPSGEKPGLVEGISRELRATQLLLANLRLNQGGLTVL